MFGKICTTILLILILSFSLGLNCSTLIESQKIINFFSPDDDTYTAMQLPFNEGLEYIQQIQGSREEIFIAFPSSYNDQIVFVDIGFNAQFNKRDTSVYYNPTSLIEYIIKRKCTTCIYFIHNHPRNGLSPPSFQDFFTLSNLKKEFAIHSIDTKIIGLVVSKNGIWKYDTTEKLEAEVFNNFRGKKTRYKQEKAHLSSLFYTYVQDWADLAESLEKKPDVFCKEMEKKGVLLEYYSSCNRYVKTLIPSKE